MSSPQAATQPIEAEKKKSTRGKKAADTKVAGIGSPKAAVEVDKDKESYSGEERTGGVSEESYIPRHTGVTSVDAANLPSTSVDEVPQQSPSMDVKDYRTPDSFFTTLCHRRAGSFAIGGKANETPIWVCNRNDLITDVLKGMMLRNILSVPVMLASDKYYGFLDMVDIVRYTVNHFGTSAFGVEKSFWELVQEEDKFATKTVQDLMQFPMSNRHMFVPISVNYSAFAVLEALAREPGLRRLAVVTDRVERQLVNFITQSQCVKWLSKHMKLLGSKKDKPVKLCPKFFKSVISVKESDITMDAFNLMVSHNIQGVAVCDKNGSLVGNLSLRDHKIIGADVALFWRLHQTVKNFLVKVSADYKRMHPETIRHRHAIYILDTATLKDVIQTLCLHDIHRVYICNNRKDRIPIGVISLRDLLQEIITDDREEKI